MKEVLKENGDRSKDTLKYARKLVNRKKDIITFQLTDMPNCLPLLIFYNWHFKLEDWQCNVLHAIDDNLSAVVCAPTLSGKTNKAHGTVLFVLPSEVLVWQIAATPP